MRNEPFDELIFGRVLAQDLLDIKGNTLLTKDTLLDAANVQLILDAEIDTITVRSPLTCDTVSGVCQHCFGIDLSTRNMVQI